MKGYTTIDISLHPLAWECLKRTAINPEQGILLFHDWPYDMIIQSLEEEHIATAYELKHKPQYMQAGKILVPLKDFKCSGTYIRISQQVAISLALYRAEMNNICTQAFKLRSAFDTKLAPTLYLICSNLGYDSSIINSDTLEEYYKRHFQPHEETAKQLKQKTL